MINPIGIAVIIANIIGNDQSPPPKRVDAVTISTPIIQIIKSLVPQPEFANLFIALFVRSSSRFSPSRFSPCNKSKRAAPPFLLPESTRPIIEPPYPSFQILPSESTRPIIEPPYPSFQILPSESTRPIIEPPYPSFQILPSESTRPTIEPPYPSFQILPSESTRPILEPPYPSFQILLILSFLSLKAVTAFSARSFSKVVFPFSQAWKGAPLIFQQCPTKAHPIAYSKHCLYFRDTPKKEGVPHTLHLE